MRTNGSICLFWWVLPLLLTIIELWSKRLCTQILIEFDVGQQAQNALPHATASVEPIEYDTAAAEFTAADTADNIKPPQPQPKPPISLQNPPSPNAISADCANEFEPTAAKTSKSYYVATDNVVDAYP